MGFKEELQKHGIQINERRAHITNEETTKQALVIPFLQVLGYDVFNPLEVQPEYYADFGKKKGEKVDYAVFKDSTPIIFIEAKPIDGDLTNYDAQLSRYFNAVPEVELGIITNGIEYRFFTDIKMENVMDDMPFYTVKLDNLKESDIETLQHFRKETYTSEKLSQLAEELAYTNALNEMLKNQIKTPTDEFVRFLIREVGVSRVTIKEIERFRSIVKRALSNAILDIVSLGLIQQEQIKNQPAAPGTPTDKALETAEQAGDIGEVLPPETTDEEKRGYEIIRVLLQKAGRDIKDLNYKDTYNYFSINYHNFLKWFIRLKLDATNKNILVKLDLKTVEGLVNGFKAEPAPKGQGLTRVYINNVDDLMKLDKLIVACYDDVVKKS